MKVRFIGSNDPTDDVVCDVFGLTFNKDEWVDLADVPPPLLTNPTFETKAPKGNTDPAPAAPEPEVVAEASPPQE